MIEKFRTYIEREPWDEALLRQEKQLKAVCWAVIVLAVLYFGPVCVGILLR
ncbi:MAG: hypothetical protein A4E74_01533 [Syntrophus sp. PtaB.Bin075]|nr:MAG: hypothetical protein A4E74_01533 [Syntrophus sp. PtaB.Bin075]